MTGGPEQAPPARAALLSARIPRRLRPIKPVLASYATRIKHFGPPGSGKVAKLIRNYLVLGMIGARRRSLQRRGRPVSTGAISTR